MQIEYMYRIESNKNGTGWKSTGYFKSVADYTAQEACKSVREAMQSVGEFDERDTVKFRAVRENE